MYTEFTNITDYLDCKYQLEINDKFIGKFYGYQEFKKLIKSYIKSRLIELLEKRTLDLDAMIIYSVRVSIKDFLDKQAELIEKGTPYKIPDYICKDKYTRSVIKYIGKNIFQLIDLLQITIKK